MKEGYQKLKTSNKFICVNSIAKKITKYKPFFAASDNKQVDNYEGYRPLDGWAITRNYLRLLLKDWVIMVNMNFFLLLK